IGNVSGLNPKKNDTGYAVNLFGKPARALQCDCERSNEPSLLQMVYLRNDQEVQKMLDRPDGWLKQLARANKTETQELVRQAYVRVLSRVPAERESSIAMRYLKDAGDVSA